MCTHTHTYIIYLFNLIVLCWDFESHFADELDIFLPVAKGNENMKYVAHVLLALANVFRMLTILEVYKL